MKMQLNFNISQLFLLEITIAQHEGTFSFYTDTILGL